MRAFLLEKAMSERIARVAQEYADRRVDVGQPFDVEQVHIDILLRLGRIEPLAGEFGYVAHDIQATKPAQYHTRDMNAERTKRPHNRKAVQ